MASVFKEYYSDKLDMEKVIQMLLIHDLGEVYAGDTWVYDEKGKKVPTRKNCFRLIGVQNYYL